MLEARAHLMNQYTQRQKRDMDQGVKRKRGDSVCEQERAVILCKWLTIKDASWKGIIRDQKVFLCSQGLRGLIYSLIQTQRIIKKF